jgi:hypothetical protein
MVALALTVNGPAYSVAARGDAESDICAVV